MKYPTIASLLASSVLATYHALNSRNNGPLNAAFSAREAHLRLLGRDALGIAARQYYCPSDEVFCGTSNCMQPGNVCCDDGSNCPAGEICWGTSFTCCSPGDIVCGDGCMPPGSACCDTNADYCPTGNSCAVASDGSGDFICCPDGAACDGQITTFQAGATITGPESAAPSTAIVTTPATSTAAAPTTPAAPPPAVTTPPPATTTPTTLPPTSTTAEGVTPTTDFATPTESEVTAAASTSTFSGFGVPITIGSELIAVLAAAVVLL